MWKLVGFAAALFILFSGIVLIGFIKVEIFHGHMGAISGLVFSGVICFSIFLAIIAYKRISTVGQGGQ
jgi:hypothetical protein